MSPLSPRIGENPGLRGVFNAHSAPAMVKIQAEAGLNYSMHAPRRLRRRHLGTTIRIDRVASATMNT